MRVFVKEQGQTLEDELVDLCRSFGTGYFRCCLVFFLHMYGQLARAEGVIQHWPKSVSTRSVATLGSHLQSSLLEVLSIGCP
jgi:hypothetical protein